MSHIVVADKESCVWRLLERVPTYDLHEMLPSLRLIRQCDSITILVETKGPSSRRTDLAGLPYVRSLRFWWKLQRPLFLVSFFSDEVLRVDSLSGRLFGLADRFIRLPLGAEDLNREALEDISAATLDSKLQCFTANNVKGELRNLVGHDMNHLTPFGRDLMNNNLNLMRATEESPLLADALVFLLKNAETEVVPSSRVIAQAEGLAGYLSGDSIIAPPITELVNHLSHITGEKP